MHEFIDSLHLKNFQSHRRSYLELSRGINVITGESDQGKSSIIRALYWLFFNKPSGNAFITWGKSSCSIEITSNKNSIKRIRSKNTNSYKINNQTFDAVRTSVPKEIDEIIKILPVNIQLQDDPYFLLSDQPGDIAKKLNQVVGIDQIDRSLSYVNLLYSRQNSAIKHLNEQIKENEERLAKYKNFSYIEKIFSKYQGVSKKADQSRIQIKKINNIVEKTEDLRNTISKEKTIRKLEKRVNELGNTINDLHSEQEKITRIKNTVSNIHKTQKLINKINPHSKKLKSLINQIELHIKEEDALDFDQITKLNSDLRKQKKLVETLANEQGKAAHDLEQFKEKIKICPLCEQTLS
jgi:exonuclease SbcC